MKESDLTKFGYPEGEDVVLTLAKTDATTFCIEAKGSDTQIWHYASKAGTVEQGPC